MREGKSGPCLMGSIFTSLSQLGALARGQNNSLALFGNDYANFIPHHEKTRLPELFTINMPDELFI